jgi:spore coat protein CotH
VVALASGLAACTPTAEDGAVFYDPDRIVEISIEMAATDWTALRAEAPPARESSDHHGPACLPHNNPGFAYTMYEARVTIDGESLDGVGIKKRAWCGSRSADKPALKLDFDRFVEGREWHGLEGLTLNNAIQDPSYIRQCLAYTVFAAAGVPASRCNFARVSVNGSAPELYVNVEPIKRMYVRRQLSGDDGSGSSYKGFLADFSPDLVQYFDKELNEDDPDRSDLDSASLALDPAVDDAGLVSSAATVVDLDSFFAYWAVEVLVAHTDGYAGNRNNFVIYHANDGRFRFLPWGVDATLGTFGTPTGITREVMP